jgi:hypothetical protein
MQISTTTLAVFAVIEMLGLVGVVAVTIMSVPEDAEAKCVPRGLAFNASQGRCFH